MYDSSSDFGYDSGDSSGEGRPERLRLGRGTRVPNTRYEITGWLGEGGMGTVFEARHLDLDRPAALKVLHPELCADPEKTDGFRREARTTGHIGCDQIVSVHDFATLPDGRMLYVMELLEGDTLDSKSGPITEFDRVIAILRQCCKGLAAAHSIGVVHRDIKPENIFLLAGARRPDTVKIMDFGIAEILSAGATRGELAGTPHYMAPEQIRSRPCDARTDIYALGCTAFELLTGAPPFTGDGLKQILRGHLKTEPEFPEGSQVPSSLQAVVLRCLAKEPDDRFADIADLEASLCEAQIDLGLTTAWDHLPLPDIDPDRRAEILASMPDPEAVLRPRANRMYAGLAGAAAAALMVTVGFVVFAGGEDELEVSQVEVLSQEAVQAAARAYYVYPPADLPRTPTAFQKILAIEELDNDTAEDRAVGLRAEFAQTLVGLGDQYWDRPGGRAFALDYYAQAILFDEENVHARERSMLTHGQLTVLFEKARSGEFAAGELVAAQPLVVLASTEPTSDESMDDMRTVAQESSSTVAWNLERLAHGMRPGTKLAPSGPAVAAQGPAATKHGTASARPGSADGAAALVAAAPVELAPLPTEVAPAPAKGTLPDAVKPAAGTDAKSGGDSQASKSPTVTVDRPEARRLARLGTQALTGTRWQEAERLLHQALAADPRCHEALISMSDLHFEQDKVQQAINFARRATRIAPKNASYRLRLGDAYFRVSRYAEARREYEKGAELGSAAAHKRLAKLEAKLGG